MNIDQANLSIYINPTYTPQIFEIPPSVPEGFCTTNYSSRGECSVCGTEVCADISEVENGNLQNSR